ncbi:MAG: CPBP family intramembrane metalloprotease [Sphingomonadaceae bacterium]|nr:CPBP family intramembrane metalloprotease [Sphingomonadaceae bacterium]MCP5393113.1 CPBP family intramembrane metalloprotease [Sphingomonadaceae bacterium]
MTGNTTTPLPAPEAASLPAATARSEWRSYLSFLKRPVLPERVTGIGAAAVKATLRLYLLDLLIMGGLILTALAAIAAGFVPPAHAMDDLEMTASLVFAIVIFAPLAEELLFRGWLSGRPGAVLSLLVLGAGVIAIILGSKAQPIASGLALIGALIAALVLAILLRKRAPWRWFARAFPIFFWLSTIAFALVHMLNYKEGSLATLLPLVIPQFIAGSIFGYARVRYGLWSNMLLHVLHNGTLVGGIALALMLGGGASA